MEELAASEAGKKSPRSSADHHDESNCFVHARNCTSLSMAADCGGFTLLNFIGRLFVAFLTQIAVPLVSAAA